MARDLAYAPAMARLLSSSHGLNRDRFAPTDWFLFVAIGLIWGSSFVLIEVGLTGFEPGLLTWLRVASGALTLSLIPRARAPIDREDRPRVLLLSFVWVAVPFTLFPIAQQWITSATTGMVNGITPLAATIITSLLLRHRPRAVQLAGLLLGFGGVVLISLPSMGAGTSEARGVFLVLAGSLLYGLAMSIGTPLQQRYGSLPVMARMLRLATIWTAPFGLAGLSSATWGTGPVFSVLALGAINTGVAYLVMGNLIRRVGATRGSFAIYLIPAVAVILGILVLGESVAPVALVGVGLVIGGAILASRRDH